MECTNIEINWDYSVWVCVCVRERERDKVREREREKVRNVFQRQTDGAPILEDRVTVLGVTIACAHTHMNICAQVL